MWFKISTFTRITSYNVCYTKLLRNQPADKCDKETDRSHDADTDDYVEAKVAGFDIEKDELDEFKTEIKEETKFEKDTRVEVLANARSGYYEIVGMNQYSNLISQSDFKALTNTNQRIYLHYWESGWQQVRQYRNNFV